MSVIAVDEKSPLDSKSPKKANRKRKVVITLLSAIDDGGKKNAPRSMSHGTLIEPLPRGSSQAG